MPRRALLSCPVCLSARASYKDGASIANTALLPGRHFIIIHILSPGVELCVRAVVQGLKITWRCDVNQEVIERLYRISIQRDCKLIRLITQARIQGFFGGARTPPPPPTAVCNIFFIFKPTDVNFPLPFKFHCRIQST